MAASDFSGYVLKSMASRPNRMEKQYLPDPSIRLVRSNSTPHGAVESLLEGRGIESRVEHSTKSNIGIESRVEHSTKCNIAVNIWRANSENVSLIPKDFCPPYGIMSIVGRRSEMEDTVAAVPLFYCAPSKGSRSGAFHFFGVYDGHGGSQASVFCKERLHQTLVEELRALSPCRFDDFHIDYAEWKMAMSNCFNKIDIAVGGTCPSGNCFCSCDDTKSSHRNNNGSKNTPYSTCCRDVVAPENVGSTAVVAVVTPSQIVVANCGDSRAVLYRGGKAIPFSKDHKPDREDEMVRIEAAGGRVIQWNGYRVGGFLAMSRAIGDRFLKQYVISEPEVTCTERTDEDEFLVLATDGLWDVLSNERVCEVVRKCLAGYRPHRFNADNNPASVTVAATLLTKLALARGSTDNISVIVIDLNKERSRRRNRYPTPLNIQTNL